MTGRRRVGAAFAALGGACWMVKSVGILVTGEQVPLLVDLALPFFGVAALLMAVEPHDSRGPRLLSIVVAVVSVSAGVVVLVGVALDVWVDPAIAVSTLALLVSLVAIGLRSPLGQHWGFSTPHPAALCLGLATVPAVVVGGLLAEIGERLLEAPIAVLGLLWVALGVLLWIRGDHAVEHSQGQVSR